MVTKFFNVLDTQMDTTRYRFQETRGKLISISGLSVSLDRYHRTKI